VRDLAVELDAETRLLSNLRITRHSYPLWLRLLTAEAIAIAIVRFSS
jgi:hypothetical protein